MPETIDTRDLIERRQEIEEMFEEPDEYGYLFQDLRIEKAQIDNIEDAVDDFPYGETLIHEDYFVEYAQQLAEDVGYITGDEEWPLNCIDWIKAAEQLEDDYFSVEYLDDTYYAR